MQTDTIPSAPPTVPAPARAISALPPPPRVPWEFALFVKHDGAPEFDPLCDLFHPKAPR